MILRKNCQVVYESMELFFSIIFCFWGFKFLRSCWCFSLFSLLFSLAHLEYWNGEIGNYFSWKEWLSYWLGLLNVILLLELHIYLWLLWNWKLFTLLQGIIIPCNFLFPSFFFNFFLSTFCAHFCIWLYLSVCVMLTHFL